MSKSPKRLMPPVPAAGRTHVQRVQMQDFSRRLYQKMVDARMNQSQLAALVWGTTTDTRGYTVSKNRERISQYINGKSYPDPKNLTLICEALGCKPEDLAPDITAATIDRENPEIAMTAIAGHGDRVHLQVNKLVPLALAAKVITLLTTEDP